MNFGTLLFTTSTYLILGGHFAWSQSKIENLVDTTDSVFVRPQESHSQPHVNRALDLSLSHSKSTTEILKTVPGVEVVQLGGAGQPSSVFIRGARSESTLVLIDGIEVNDAMSPANGFDFSILSTDEIESIEVFRGPRSVRFGAGALGGVVLITTKQCSLSKKLGYQLEGGSYNSDRLAVWTSGKTGSWGYNLSGSRTSTEGFSASDPTLPSSDHDGALSTSAQIKLSWEPKTNINLTTLLRRSYLEAELDNFGGP